MLAIHTILHPTDFSERSGYAFEAAFALARDYGARLLLLHAMSPRKGGPGADPDQEYKEAIQAKLRWLQPVGAPVGIEPMLREGDAVEEIIRAARESGCDLIIMGTHGKTDERGRPMGRVAEQVIGQAPCPVVVVREPLAAAKEAEKAHPAGNARVIAALNNLVATCKDGENGYRAASADVPTPELKKLFDFYGQQRAAFAEAMLAAIHRLDTPVERKGSPTALIHRGWMNLRAMLERRDASAVIEECARGEQAALKNYAAALKLPLPPEVKTMLEEQCARLKDAQERINGLKAVRVLNDLVATCKDAEKGYLLAKDNVEPRELKELFFASAKERARFAAELEAQVHSLGDEGDVAGTFTAGLHRGWMGLKAAMKRGAVQNVIDECARGEKAAMKHYADAMTHPLPPEATNLVAQQYARVKEAHDHLAELPCPVAHV